MGSQAIDTSSASGYFEFTSDVTLVFEAVGDALLDLGYHAPPQFWDEADLSEDGREIRVTNAAGDTAYSFHLEAFSKTAATGVLRFTAGGLSTSVATTYRVYIMPGATMPAASDALGRNNVWEANTLGVWLMDNDPGAGTIADATGNGYTGTPAGSMTSGDLVAGPIGKAIDFDGTDDRLSCTRITAMEGIANLTLRAVVKQAAADTAARFIACKGLTDTADNDGRVGISGAFGDANDLTAYVENLTGNNGQVTSSSNAWSGGAWHLVALAFNGGGATGADRMKLYIDGAQPTQSATNTQTLTAATDGAFFIGCRQGSANFWNGQIAEVRLDTVTRSLNHHRTWHAIWLDHESFWTAGAWQPAVVPASTLVGDAIVAGYAIAGGYVGTPTDEQVLNIAALMAAVRDGRNLAEAIALAAPVLNSRWRVIGDPLASLVLPRAGYNVYRRATTTAASQLVGAAPAHADSFIVTGDPDSEAYYHVRSVSRCGVEDTGPIVLVRVAFDGDGNLIGPTPNAPIDLAMQRYAGGGVSVLWSYRPNGERSEVDHFNIYIAEGDAAFDFEAPAGVVAFSKRSRFTFDAGTFAHATRVRAIVAAVSPDDLEARSETVEAIADAAPPDAPVSIAVEAVAE